MIVVVISGHLRFDLQRIWTKAWTELYGMSAVPPRRSKSRGVYAARLRIPGPMSQPEW